MKAKENFRHAVVVVSLAVLACLVSTYDVHAQEASGGSLMSYYSTADSGTLRDDTRTMSERLKGMFRKNEIEKTEKKLEFSRYHSNFKNALIYLNKLAGYSEYEENISFGRDREIYNALPREGVINEDRKMVISEKYNRLETITGEEIDTYRDMIETSFDACEIYNDSLFWGDAFFEDRMFRESMEEVFTGEDYRTYEQQNRRILMKSFPEYVGRIDQLVTHWKKSPRRPASPIIASAIVDRL